ncbi:MAG: class I SAM-dependent methyltransferase [Candidatus Levybacteria bacterium]|nr:class I SAM-dependent methyltransferase [Candidatus Levybacteria bacterium]
MRITNSINHYEQRKIWDEEHRKPNVLRQMDSDKPSSGILKFWDWLKYKKLYGKLDGIEMGCGKGRNVIWLAKQGFKMTGFDFSKSAINEAISRSKRDRASSRTKFIIHDAVKPWPFKTDSFDIGIDCFTTTDIESIKGRKFATNELIRVIKPRGYILVYVMSVDDEYHKEMVRKSPANERNAFLNPISGKFEKTFERREIINLYKKYVKLVSEKRVKKIEVFFGKKYKCKHFWMIFQKTS